MNQHHQQPQQPYNQPYPQQPTQGWGMPPQAPQPPKNTTGKKIGLGCLGALGVIVVLGVIGAAVGGGSDHNGGKSSVTSSTPDSGSNQQAAEAEQPEEPAKKDKPAADDPAQDTPVKFTAKPTAFTKTILADGTNYVSILITVKNDSDEPVDINPLYFSITDTNGTKHGIELAADEKQIDTVQLGPGENISGTVTGKGNFDAKYVTYTDGLIGDPVRINVS